ncbi:hypothetical protein, partial [Moraxella lacunata]|uniref:hypothetical protein n=1 Tax=Moraxella lacunata TaxID=477 RepID=UPI002480E3D5
MQYQKVVTLFQKLHTDNEQGFISLLVVLEVNWVLAFSYKIPRNEIIHSLLALLNFPFLTFEQANHLQQTLLYAQNNTFDLSDLLIACKSRSLHNLPVWAYPPFVFAMKNEKNRTFFKEKVKFDSHSIKQAFDDEKQDLAIFHAKTESLILKIFKNQLSYKGWVRPIPLIKKQVGRTVLFYYKRFCFVIEYYARIPPLSPIY